MRSKLYLLSVLLMTSLAFQPAHGDPEVVWGPVQWSDDRGEPLPSEEVFELCWIRNLDRHCEEVPGRSLPKRVPRFDLLQIQSTGHGPVNVKTQDLQLTEDGYRLQVPRKAWLHVEDLPKDLPVTLSLYPQDDPAMPRPVLRVSPLEGGTLQVPAGAFIASLVSKGSAPHLRLLEVAPGDSAMLRYRRQPGWSLVLRASDRQTGDAVAGAHVEIEPAPGYSGLPDGEGKRQKAETGVFGLVVFSGLAEPIVEASLGHPAFLPVHVAGLSSTRGTFGYRDVPLPRGGGVDAAILLDGQQISGAECTLLKYGRDTPGSQAPPEAVLSTKSDERGLCQARKLREGSYGLRVRAPRQLVEGREAESAHVDRVVQILEGQNIYEEVVLEPTLLEGTVRRGQEPAPGYEVMILDRRNKIKNASSNDALVVARTDDQGRYEVTLWTAGDYSLFVQSQSGVPGAMKSVRLGGGRETVDFQLAADEIVGRVVDGEGRPLEHANVQLMWQGFSYRLAVTGPNGNFAFPIEKEGRAELTAHKQGYQPSKALELEVSPGLRLQPVVLTLARQPEVEGRLLTAGGSPVPGGWVAIYELEVQEPVLVGTAATGPDGRFELPLMPGRAHRIFFGGPGCPLGARSLGVPDPVTRVEILCAEAAANLEITLKTAEGTPREGAALLLARGKIVFPRRVVAAHLARLGLSATTDGSGHLALVALEPGEYRLYLADVTSPFNVLIGAPDGFLTNVTLTPWSTRVAEVSLDVETST